MNDIEHLKFVVSINLKKQRSLSNMTLKELSELTGVSVATLNRIENCAVAPQLHHINILAKFFNISLDEFVKYDKEEIETLMVMKKTLADMVGG